MDCDGMRWIAIEHCDGLRWIAMWIAWIAWIAMDCDGMRWISLEWLVELTPIRTPLHFDAPDPNHTSHTLVTHEARASTIQVRALKTALCVQTVLCGQNGAARSNGAARLNEVRQRVGRLVRRGRQGVRQGAPQIS